MSEEQVFAALRELKDADLGRGAGPEVEARLLEVFHRRSAQRKWRRAAIWTVSAAAAGLIGMVMIRPKPPAPPLQVQRPVEVVSAAPEQAPQVHPPVRRKLRVPAREVVTPFVPLMESPPAFERGELVRVMVPAETMREAGFPVTNAQLAGQVEADVLIGQEGLARAIRFVSFSDNQKGDR